MYMANINIPFLSKECQKKAGFFYKCFCFKKLLLYNELMIFKFGAISG